MATYAELDIAVDVVSSTISPENWAFYDRTTRQIHVHIDEDISGIDDETERNPDPTQTIDIPDKNELGLGRDLVFAFIRKTMPDDEDHVRDLFRRRGAYANLKQFLSRKNRLDAWYDYENTETKKILTAWCAENDIVLDDIPSA